MSYHDPLAPGQTMAVHTAKGVAIRVTCDGCGEEVWKNDTRCGFCPRCQETAFCPPEETEELFAEVTVKDGVHVMGQITVELDDTSGGHFVKLQVSENHAGKIMPIEVTLFLDFDAVDQLEEVFTRAAGLVSRPSW